jgi:hypothetical protein
LYDGAKNLLLVPFLLRVRQTNTTPGAVAARFVFWYAFPRIFIDLFRDYPTHRLATGTGQTLNLLMTALGLWLLSRSRRRPAQPAGRARGGRPRRTSRGPCSPSGTAAAVCAAAVLLPRDPEQLDAGHPGEIRCAPSRSAPYVALSGARLGAAGGHPGAICAGTVIDSRSGVQ